MKLCLDMVKFLVDTRIVSIHRCHGLNRCRAKNHLEQQLRQGLYKQIQSLPPLLPSSCQKRQMDIMCVGWKLVFSMFLHGITQNNRCHTCPNNTSVSQLRERDGSVEVTVKISVFHKLSQLCIAFSGPAVIPTIEARLIYET